MKRFTSFTKIVFTLALTALAISFFAFRQKDKSGKYSFREKQTTDTTTSGQRNRNGSDRDFYKIEEQMKHLQLQMEKLDAQMKKLDGQFQKLDFSDQEKEISEAIKNIEMDKNNEQIEEALKGIDLNEINNSVERVKVNKLRMKEVEKQLERVKTNLQKQRFNLQFKNERIRENVERALNDAKQAGENAREEIRNVKELTDVLEKDGLLDKSKAYKIEVKKGELYINGKKQSKEVSDKYRQYYREGDFLINMSEGDDFTI
jgi:chromosome segregation ATPase